MPRPTCATCRWELTAFSFCIRTQSGAFTKAADDPRPILHARRRRHLPTGSTKRSSTKAKLSVTRQSSAQAERTWATTNCWSTTKLASGKAISRRKLGDLAAGDELLVNLTGARPPARAAAPTSGSAPRRTSWRPRRQRKRHVDFLKKRGLPAWIDRVEGKKVTVTLFGDPADLAALMKDEGIVPSQWATEHRRVDVVVANAELRTYNPPVDRQSAARFSNSTACPTEGYGCERCPLDDRARPAARRLSQRPDRSAVRPSVLARRGHALWRGTLQRSTRPSRRGGRADPISLIAPTSPTSISLVSTASRASFLRSTRIIWSAES